MQMKHERTKRVRFRLRVYSAPVLILPAPQNSLVSCAPTVSAGLYLRNPSLAGQAGDKTMARERAFG